jgi:hypothetical protein
VRRRDRRLYILPTIIRIDQDHADADALEIVTTHRDPQIVESPDHESRLHWMRTRRDDICLSMIVPLMGLRSYAVRLWLPDRGELVALDHGVADRLRMSHTTQETEV